MSDQRIQYSEEMVGAGHPTKSDTINRLALVEADSDGHGKHRWLKAQATPPATAADEGALYAKSVSGQVEAFYRGQGDGAEVQLTSAGRLNAPPPAVPLEDLWMDPDAPAENVVVGTVATRKVMAIKLADGVTQGFLGFATLPDMTRDYQLVIECGQSAAQSAKAILLGVGIMAIAAGEEPCIDANDVAIGSGQTIATRSDTGLLVVEHASFRIAKTHLHADNQLVRVYLCRYGGNAADTHTGATHVYRAFFKAV